MNEPSSDLSPSSPVVEPTIPVALESGDADDVSGDPIARAVREMVAATHDNATVRAVMDPEW